MKHLLIAFSLLLSPSLALATTTGSTVMISGSAGPLLMAARKRRRRRKRKKRRKRAKPAAAKTQSKKANKPTVAPVPSDAKSSVPAKPKAALADLIIPPALAAEWSQPMIEGLVQGLMQDEVFDTLFSGDSLQKALPASQGTACLEASDLDQLRKAATVETAFWFKLQPIRDQVRLQASRQGPERLVSLSMILPANPAPDASWFKALGRALVNANSEADLPAAPVVEPVVKSVEEAPTTTVEEPAKRQRLGSGLFVASMGMLAAGFGASFVEDASAMESSADGAPSDQMQASINESKRVGERLQIGGLSLAVAGLGTAAWSLIKPR